MNKTRVVVKWANVTLVLVSISLCALAVEVKQELPELGAVFHTQPQRVVHAEAENESRLPTRAEMDKIMRAQLKVPNLPRHHTADNFPTADELAPVD